MPTAAPLPPGHTPPVRRSNTAGQTPVKQGVVLKTEAGLGSFVDVGLDRTALVEGPPLAPGARVTLRLGGAARVKFVPSYGESMLLGEVGRGGAGRDGIRSNASRRGGGCGDGMGWDGMGWDGMGWDGMGRDGMGWDGM